MKWHGMEWNGKTGMEWHKGMEWNEVRQYGLWHENGENAT